MELIILTGAINSGKTTILQTWILAHENAHGILSPKENNVRHFFDIYSNEKFNMLANDSDTDKIFVGKYSFSKTAFDKAENIIIDAAKNNYSTIVIDEIGPLELKEEGFSTALTYCLKNCKKQIIIVVRESLVEAVIEKFSLKRYVPKILHKLE